MRIVYSVFCAQAEYLASHVASYLSVGVTGEPLYPVLAAVELPARSRDTTNFSVDAESLYGDRP